MKFLAFIKNSFKVLHFASLLLFAFLINANAEDAKTVKEKLAACGGGLVGEASSKFSEALSATEKKVPGGGGDAFYSFFGTEILEILKTISDDQIKKDVLIRYYDCIDGKKKDRK